MPGAQATSRTQHSHGSCLSHASHVTYERVMWHMNESCHAPIPGAQATSRTETSHIWTVTSHTDIYAPTQRHEPSDVAYKWVISQLNTNARRPRNVTNPARVPCFFIRHLKLRIHNCFAVVGDIPYLDQPIATPAGNSSLRIMMFMYICHFVGLPGIPIAIRMYMCMCVCVCIYMYLPLATAAFASWYLCIYGILLDCLVSQCKCACAYVCICVCMDICIPRWQYGVATVSRIDKIICLFCKRDL